MTRKYDMSGSVWNHPFAFSLSTILSEAGIPIPIIRMPIMYYNFSGWHKKGKLDESLNVAFISVNLITSVVFSIVLSV